MFLSKCQYNLSVKYWSIFVPLNRCHGGKPVLNSLFSLGSCPYVQFLATSRWTRYWESAFYALPAAPNGSFCYLGCRRRTYVWPIIALSEFNDFATRHFIVARSKRHPSDGPFFLAEMVPSIVAEDGIALRVYCLLAGGQRHYFATRKTPLNTSRILQRSGKGAT